MTSAEIQTRSIFSERLQSLLIAINSGDAPNAGRFCGYCYSPLAKQATLCEHCGRSPASWPPARRVPDEVITMYRVQRSHERWVVLSIAYGGLLAGIILGLLPIAFFDVRWWTMVAFFATLVFSYFFFANLANTLGDLIGYHWGQQSVAQRWEKFVAMRDEEPRKLE